MTTATTERVAELRLRRLISVTLRGGLLVAASVGALGAGLYLAMHWNDKVTFDTFRGVQPQYASLPVILHNALASSTAGEVRGRAVAQTGILLLVLTPVMRVVFSLFGFAVERDWTYVSITAVVLLVLTVSLFLR